MEMLCSMLEQVHIQQLIFDGNCGVTETERFSPQPLAVDVTVDYPFNSIHHIAATDQLHQAIDYAHIAETVTHIGTSQSFVLLETMAEHMVSQIFEVYPASRIYLDLRKINPPIKNIQGSVGIRINRSRQEHLSVNHSEPQPAKFLLENVQRIPHGHILDLACGTGRNTIFLATQGYHVTAIDRDQEALDVLKEKANAHHLRQVSTRSVDLESGSQHFPELSPNSYDAIIVFLYLYRPIFSSLRSALKPGGLLVYETFLIDNHIQHNHPRRKEFCLQHNELLQLVSGMRVLHYHEGEQSNSHEPHSTYTAKLIAQKESPSVQA